MSIGAVSTGASLVEVLVTVFLALVAMVVAFHSSRASSVFCHSLQSLSTLSLHMPHPLFLAPCYPAYHHWLMEEGSKSTWFDNLSADLVCDCSICFRELCSSGSLGVSGACGRMATSPSSWMLKSPLGGGVTSTNETPIEIEIDRWNEQRENGTFPGPL